MPKYAFIPPQGGDQVGEIPASGKVPIIFYASSSQEANQICKDLGPGELFVKLKPSVQDVENLTK